jgi:hypothetical protein
MGSSKLSILIQILSGSVGEAAEIKDAAGNLTEDGKC